MAAAILLLPFSIVFLNRVFAWWRCATTSWIWYGVLWVLVTWFRTVFWFWIAIFGLYGLSRLFGRW